MIKENHIQAYRRISPNFMTPNILEYVMTPDNRIIELSQGTGIGGESIWGVTEFDEELHTTRRGQMHRSKKSARIHFNKLIQG